MFFVRTVFIGLIFLSTVCFWMKSSCSLLKEVLIKNHLEKNELRRLKKEEKEKRINNLNDNFRKNSMKKSKTYSDLDVFDEDYEDEF